MNYLFLANSINVKTLLIVLAIVAVLAIVFAALIVLVSKVCYVEPNEKAEQIQSHLAGANCGGCGYAGCSDFAKALAEGKADLSSCGPSSNEAKAEIAKILNIPFSASERKVATVHCAGGKISLNKYTYVGNDGCIAQAGLLGGSKVCPNGCLGGGTCEALCPYHAINVKDGVAFVSKALCTACGVCVKNCPKKIIELIPASAKVFVACSTTCKGKEVMNMCKVGCIGCGLCAKNCPNGAITMVNNIAVIDYSKCTSCKICVSKCPRKCIQEF
jgi:Na+-translocating ferredoxin:NAD+ oxidoreductase RNF subunit RnfB